MIFLRFAPGRFSHSNNKVSTLLTDSPQTVLCTRCRSIGLGQKLFAFQLPVFFLPRSINTHPNASFVRSSVRMSDKWGEKCSTSLSYDNGHRGKSRATNLKPGNATKKPKSKQKEKRQSSGEFKRVGKMYCYTVKNIFNAGSLAQCVPKTGHMWQ